MSTDAVILDDTVHHCKLLSLCMCVNILHKMLVPSTPQYTQIYEVSISRSFSVSCFVHTQSALFLASCIDVLRCQLRLVSH